MRARFSGIEPVFAWGIHGWRVPRMKKVEWTTGIMDPNWLFVGLAERKAGITLHMWNPVDYGCLQRHAASLKDAGFKVMVGCIQFNRKSEYPMSAVKSLLDDVAKGWNADG